MENNIQLTACLQKYRASVLRVGASGLGARRVYGNVVLISVVQLFYLDFEPSNGRSHTSAPQYVCIMLRVVGEYSEAA